MDVSLNTAPCSFAGRITPWAEHHLSVSSSNFCHPRACSAAGLQLTRPAMEQGQRQLHFLCEAGSKLVTQETDHLQQDKDFQVCLNGTRGAMAHFAVNHLIQR